MIIPGQVWNGLHKVTGLGPGIHIGPGGSSTRISGCYIDNTWLNLVDPSRVTIADGLFYVAYNEIVAGPRSSVNGLVMQGNIYSGPLNQTNVVVSGQFKRENVEEVQFDGTIRFNEPASPIPTVTTSVSLAAELVNETMFRFEFHRNQSAATQLLFPWIDTISYSVVFGANDGQFVQHYAEIASDTEVLVRFERPVTAKVSVTATQGQS